MKKVGRMRVNFFLDTIDGLSLRILDTFKRFPLASFSAFMVALIWMMLIEIDYTQQSPMSILANKVAFVSTMGIFLFPALHLLNRLIWSKLFGIALIVAYFYFLPTVIESRDITRHLLLLLALCFMFFWAPFINTNISNKNIWEWTQKILLILLATFVLSLTLYIVVAITLYSLNMLFEIEIENRRYLQLAVLVMGFFSVNFFLSQMPKYILLVQRQKYSKVGRVFTKYVLTPTMLLYMVILFGYIVKIILLQSWEKITIDGMIITFSLLAIGTYMFWTPLWVQSNNKFRKLIWGSTFILSIVLALSIWIRFKLGVDIAGLYLISLFALWLGVISLYFLFFKNASYKWLFFSISLSILIFQSGYVMNLVLSLK